jgi:hypothetical protein
MEPYVTLRLRLESAQHIIIALEQSAARVRLGGDTALADELNNDAEEVRRCLLGTIY